MKDLLKLIRPIFKKAGIFKFQIRNKKGENTFIIKTPLNPEKWKLIHADVILLTKRKEISIHYDFERLILTIYITPKDDEKPEGNDIFCPDQIPQN